MKRHIDIMLGNDELSLGELRYDRQGRRESAPFMYMSDWLDNENCFAIDPTLPLVSGFQFHARSRFGPGTANS